MRTADIYRRDRQASRQRVKVVMAAVAAMGSPCNAAPAPMRPSFEEVRIARCITEAADGRAWLERTLWGLRDQEAGWIGASVRNDNGTFDLGPLQINSWWVPRMAKLLDRPEAHISHWLRYDPCFNAGAARWIFLTAYLQTGNYWQAVGIYHSPTGWRQRRYAMKVSAHLQSRFGRPSLHQDSVKKISPPSGRRSSTDRSGGGP